MTMHFDTLTALRDEWQAQQPLQAEREGRLWQKLRLEWNYHSNHIEGNTLTYGETELLLLHDLTTHNHTLREYLEMKAHDVGIGHVRELASDPDHVITEADIRDLNKIILKEPFWKAAQTADGQPTRKEIIPGQYKTTPNNVRTVTGEMFYFASVEDTAPKMQDLAAWIRRELATPTLHPAAFAAKLHYDFVRIHPFDDGNGRVARLLTNYVLLCTGYLPVIVRTDDKAGYLAALRQGDVGNLAPFTEYMAKLAEWSLQLGIKAAKGESIEELTDVEKELAIFIRNQEGHKHGDPGQTPESIRNLIKVSLKAVIDRIQTKLQKLTPLFRKCGLEIRDGFGSESNASINFPDLTRIHVAPGEEMVFTFVFQGYQGEAIASFNYQTRIGFHFPKGHYALTQDKKVLLKRDYDSLVLADEAEALSAQILATAFAAIKKEAEKERYHDTSK